MAVNTQKLLPSSRESALTKISSSKIIRTPVVKKKTISTQKLIGSSKDSDSTGVQNLLSGIDSLFKVNLREDKKEQSKKRKEKEKSDYEKEEKKLEAPKEAKKFKFPTLLNPAANFLDRIKRFIFFTALGWLFTKFQDQLPKLVGVFKIITQVYGFVENTFKFLLESFVTFVDLGYTAHDNIRKSIEQLGGKDAAKTFDEFSNHLKNLLNGAIIASMLTIRTAPKGPKTPPGTGSGYQAGFAAGYAAGVASRGKGPRYRAPGEAAAGRTFGENLQRQTLTRQRMLAPTGPQGPLDRIGRGVRGAGAQLQTGTLFKRGAGIQKALYNAPGKIKGVMPKGMSAGMGRIPIIGPLVVFSIRTLVYGEKPEKAAAAAVGMGIGQAIGTFIGTLGAGALGLGTAGLGAVVAPLIIGAGSVIGGLVGEWLGTKLYDLISGFGKDKKPQQKAKGGTVYGNKKVPPRRTIRIAKRKPQKIKPKQSQPGKDVGGKKKIRELYPDPSVRTDIEGEQKGGWWNLLPPLPANATAAQKEERDKKIKALPNSYKALTSVSKALKDIPFGIGALMGGAVDIALGEKLPSNAIQGLSSGISYLISSIANRQISSSLSNIEREISKMQTGGVVPRFKDFTKRDDVDLGKDINKILNGLIQKKVDNAIREVQKQLMPAKYGTGGPGGGAGGAGGGGGGGGGGGQPLPTGKNGRYSRGELTYVGKMNPAEPKVKFENYWYGRNIYLRPDAAAAFKDAQKAAGSKIGWVLNSGYRSLEHQQAVLDAGYPGAAVGYSNHGDGIALDIQTGTNGHTWLIRNGGKFGWRWPNIPGDEVHFYYDGSYTPKGQKKAIPDIFKQESKPKPGDLSPIFQRPGQSQVRQSGEASWYGPGFYGNRTASGDPFREGDTEYTAAHRTLPFGTKVTVTNKANGKSIQVRINDRGPFKKGRIIDLNKAARDALGGQDLMNVDLSYQGGGYVPKQSPKNRSSSLSMYPSYSAEGGMMIAIQPMIIEKPIPIPMSQNKTIIFPVPISVNNNTASLSR